MEFSVATVISALLIVKPELSQPGIAKVFDSIGSAGVGPAKAYTIGQDFRWYCFSLIAHWPSTSGVCWTAGFHMIRVGLPGSKTVFMHFLSRHDQLYSGIIVGLEKELLSEALYQDGESHSQGKRGLSGRDTDNVR